jgi:hypothetical protein
VSRHELPSEAIEAMHALLSSNPSKRPSLVDVLARLAPLNSTHPQASDSPKLVVSNSQQATIPKLPVATPKLPVTTPKLPVVTPKLPLATAAPPPKAEGQSRGGAPLAMPSVVMLAAADAKAATAGATPAPRAQAKAAPTQAPVPQAQVKVPPVPVAPPPAAPPPAKALPVGAVTSPSPAQIRIPVAPLEIRPPVQERIEPAPLQVGSPSWVRPSTNAGITVNSASPFQSRASVWRWPVILSLLAGAVATFVWLPEEVKQSAVAQVAAIAARNGIVIPAPTSPESDAASKDFRKMAEAKLSAEHSRDQAAQLEHDLRANGVATRNIPSFIAGVEARAHGGAAFDKRDFGNADADFRAAMKSFQATRQAIPQLRSAAMVAGNAALSQCLREQAIAEFRYALALMPHDAAAKEGMARAQVCEEVFAHINAGTKAEESGDAAAARKEYEAALQLDPKSASAQDALSALTGQVGDLQYSREVADALEDLRTHRYSAAATAVAAADKLKPNSAEVQRLSQQLSDVHSNERLQALTVEAAEDERAERWAEALDAYRAMLAVDETLVLARDGALRSEDRMKLDAELAGFIDNPERLAAEEVRTAAAEAMARAHMLASRGQRIETQLSRISVLLSQFDAPVHVNITSDGLTHVVIYRVGDLGKFNDRSVSLKPGKYTFVGSRLGYRDIRRELQISAGQTDATLEIHCEEQI